MIIKPAWMSQTYLINNQNILPKGCCLNTTYLCFRSVVRKNGESERRCGVTIDTFGPLGWQSPDLGDGNYIGLTAFPNRKYYYRSNISVPKPGELVIVYLKDHRLGLIREVWPGWYLAKRDESEVNTFWKVRIPWLGRSPDFPQDKKYVRIMDSKEILWLPLPKTINE